MRFVLVVSQMILLLVLVVSGMSALAGLGRGTAALVCYAAGVVNWLFVIEVTGTLTPRGLVKLGGLALAWPLVFALMMSQALRR